MQCLVRLPLHEKKVEKKGTLLEAMKASTTFSEAASQTWLHGHLSSTVIPQAFQGPGRKPEPHETAPVNHVRHSVSQIET